MYFIYYHILLYYIVLYYVILYYVILFILPAATLFVMSELSISSSLYYLLLRHRDSVLLFFSIREDNSKDYSMDKKHYSANR